MYICKVDALEHSLFGNAGNRRAHINVFETHKKWVVSFLLFFFFLGGGTSPCHLIESEMFLN